jgi:hypothetical protein
VEFIIIKGVPVGPCGQCSCANVLPTFAHTKNRIIRTIRRRLFIIISSLKELSKLSPETPDAETKYQAAEQGKAKQGVP